MTDAELKEARQKLGLTQHEEKWPEYWEMVARVEKLAIHAHDAGRRGEPIPHYLGQQAAHIVNTLLAVAGQIKKREGK